MDEFNSMFSYIMGRAMTMVAYCTLAAFVEEMVKAEKEKLKNALGHEPTDENWRDYYDLLREQKVNQKAAQREADKGNLRRLVMGERDATFNTR
jgi:hypothetical protein